MKKIIYILMFILALSFNSNGQNREYNWKTEIEYFAENPQITLYPYSYNALGNKSLCGFTEMNLEQATELMNCVDSCYNIKVNLDSIHNSDEYTFKDIIYNSKFINVFYIKNQNSDSFINISLKKSDYYENIMGTYHVSQVITLKTESQFSDLRYILYSTIKKISQNY